MESIRDFKQLSALFMLSALLIVTTASFATSRHVFAAASTCFTRAAYTPYVTDGPSTGDAFLHGEVYLNCSTAENRTVSAYLMEDLNLSSDAQIQKYTYTDYDTWHGRTAHYGALGYVADNDTQEYYTRLRFYDPVVGSNSPDYDSSRLATHYTWRP